MYLQPTYRIVSIDDQGARFVIGEGLSGSQAEIVCQRLRVSKLFADVVIEEETAESNAPERAETNGSRCGLRRLLTALGLLSPPNAVRQQR